MDEKESIKELNYILYTLENYKGDLDDLEWSTTQIKALLSILSEKEKKVEELEKSYEIEKSISLAAIENSHKYDKILIERELRIKSLEEGIEKLYKLALRSHYYSEDCWYTCPKHPDGSCNTELEDKTKCNCGADFHNEEVKELYNLIKGGDLYADIHI